MSKRRFPKRIAVYGFKERHNWMISEPGEVPPAWVGKETEFVNLELADEVVRAAKDVALGTAPTTAQWARLNRAVAAYEKETGA